MTKPELEERLAFLQLDHADRELLGELEPLLERHADRFVGAFYRHLLSFGTTRRLLSDPAVKERLLGKQREYLLSLSSPELDDDYVRERVRIGEVHERIGLEPRWYLGAYAHYFSLLAPVVCESYHADPERGQRLLTALVRLLLFDATFAMDSYIERREEELEHLNRELAAAGRSLAREVEEQGEALRRTVRRARDAENLASVASLVAGLAHEIGTPMGVIRGHAEALEGAVTSERAEWRVRTIREQIDRISDIIQSLLNLARPREAVRESVDVAAVAEASGAFLSEKLRRREVEFLCETEPAPPIVGDRDKIQQLFLNLFLNAIDAMPDGGQLRVRVGPEGAKKIRIEVSDQGVGVAAQDVERLFEPFFTTKPAGRGNGLGLMVVDGIVADHGGQIAVDSEPDRGTTFTIHLPAAPASHGRSGTPGGSGRSR